MDESSSSQRKKSANSINNDLKLFISYRRADAAAAAGRLYDFLSGKMGEGAIFKDVDSIPYGKDFKQEIKNAIDKSNIVLVVIGKYFVNDEKRLFNEDDYVRFEISYAIKNTKTIIPVLVNDAGMPDSNDFPKELQDLSTLNGAELRNNKWTRDCEAFYEDLKKHNSTRTIHKPNESKTLPQTHTNKKQENPLQTPAYIVELEKKVKEVDAIKKQAVEKLQYEKAIELRDQLNNLESQLEYVKSRWEQAMDSLKIPDHIIELENKINEIGDARSQAAKDQQYEKAIGLRDKEIKLKRQLEFANKQWEEEVKEEALTPEHIIELKAKVQDVEEVKNQAVENQEYEKAASLRDKKERLERQLAFAETQWKEEMEKYLK